jgi:SAM-dependent methyltransferase
MTYAQRPHAFGEKKFSLLDTIIFFLRFRQVISRLPDVNNKVLADFGSGYDARLMVKLLQQYQTSSGLVVDVAFEARLSEIVNLKLLIGDLNNPLELPSESVDIGFSLAVLEHLEKPELFLSEVYRVLRSGGILLLTTPGPTSKPILEFLAYTIKIIDADEIRDHKNYFSTKDLQQMFVKSGFSETEIETHTFLFGMNNIVIARK